MTGISSRRTARSRNRQSNDEDPSSQTHNLVPNLLRERRRKPGLLRVAEFNLKAILGFCVLGLFIWLVMYNSLWLRDNANLPRVVTPLPAPKMMDLPQSLMAGLMWIGLKDGQYFLRHVCEDSDDLRTYGWLRHNGRDYGQQVLVDQDTHISTSFLKSHEIGSGYGGDWAVRIDANLDKSPMNEVSLENGHFFFYLADEGGYSLTIDQEAFDLQKSSRLVSGSREDVGGWELHINSSDDMEIHYAGFKTSHMHNLTDLVQRTLAVQTRRMGRLQLPDTFDISANIAVFQISAKLSFKVDLAFVSGVGLKTSRVAERVKSLTGVSLSKKLNEKEDFFDAKFTRHFNLTDKVGLEALTVGKAAIGNLLGGIGYFYGQSKIALLKSTDNGDGENFISYWPAALYTAVPSRSFFPRGFLWDEGFHQLLIWRWDIGICLDIIGHWLDLINVDGWIPREQILGAEALSKVPDEFVRQHPTNGNPPTLFLVLQDLTVGIERNIFSPGESDAIAAFLERAFVRLEAWFQWFNTTQSGKEPGSFYWHGRDNTTVRELNPKALSSGLDDYPRASHPSEEERHLDLRCWMLLAAKCMHSISNLLGSTNRLEKGYSLMAEELSNFDYLNEMHSDGVTGVYCDYGNHTEKVKLRWLEVMGNHAQRELVRVVTEAPKLGLVPHIGYVSLFPFMMKIIPSDSWILGKQLDIIANQSILWTKYGLRSLAKTSSLYMKRNTEHDPPYWRGQIWMNMNYMTLSALQHYAQEDGPHKERASTVYKELREILIRNVVQNYHRSGYLWEQYDETNGGKGKGSRPFTGWTSLILLVMAEA
ncbi:hypothetical protein AMTRI_Chr06g172410 [Amborella trichopoda]